MIELYHAHISTCSQKVRLCLAEKELEWTSHPIEFSTGEHLRPAYLALNPNGVVQTLVHNERPVCGELLIFETNQQFATHTSNPDAREQLSKVVDWMTA